MIKTLKLILVTDEATILEEHPNLGLSMALGIIASYLGKHGIKTSLTDMGATVAHTVYRDETLKQISVVYDKERILSYIRTGNDRQIDEIVEMFLQDMPLDYDSYGVSIGADFSMLQIHLGFAVASYLKKKTGNPVFIGGNNISYLYIFRDFYYALWDALLDRFSFIIKGPGEDVICKIIDGLNRDARGEELINIPGIIQKIHGKTVANREMTPRIIRPDWGNLDLSEYSYPCVESQKENETIYYRFPLDLTNKIVEFNRMKGKVSRLFIPYIFNYNCTYNCAFCTQSDSDRSEFVVGDVKKAVDDIEFLSKKYHSNYFYFLNNYFPSSYTYIKEFNDELKRRNLQIYWSDCGRVNGLSREKLRLLHESGCRKLVFGFESGSEKILTLIDKRLHLQEVAHVLEDCKEIGIWADLEIIIGLPYEREEEFQDTVRFLSDHKDFVNHFWLNEYFVVPNSLLGKFPEQYGIRLLKDLTTYDRLLEKNRRGFLQRNYIDLTANARLWGFDEIKEGDYRSYAEMKVHNADKIRRLSAKRNPEFNTLFDFYSKMIRLRRGVK